MSLSRGEFLDWLENVLRNSDQFTRTAHKITPVIGEQKSEGDFPSSLLVELVDGTKYQLVATRVVEFEKIQEAPWIHRIDAVPDVGREVEVMTTWGQQTATVVEARKPLRFTGIGGDVEYLMGMLRAHAGDVTHWRYKGEEAGG